MMSNGGGLGRKRSLAQKIRGISNPTRGGAFTGHAPKITSPNGFHEPNTSPPGPREAQSAGGMPRVRETNNNNNNNNPFFNDYDDAYERKGQKIQIAEQQRKRNDSIGGGEDQVTSARARAMSSPKRTPTGGMLERRVTNEGAVAGPGPGPAESSGGRFLSRVKSLKGGKRSRPERKEY